RAPADAHPVDNAPGSMVSRGRAPGMVVQLCRVTPVVRATSVSRQNGTRLLGAAGGEGRAERRPTAPSRTSQPLGCQDARVSYDITLMPRRPGQDWDEALEQSNGTEVADRTELLQVW